MRTLVGAAALSLALAVLTACGSDDDSDDVADCSDLKGETVSEGFEGCMKGDALQTVSGVIDCLDGRTLVVVRNDVGWGFQGGKWHSGRAEEAVLECSGVEEPGPTDEPSDEPTEGETELEPTESTEEPEIDKGDATQCADIWVVGATLPAGYDGCLEGRRKVLAAVFSCEDGSRLTSYDDRFYAFLGEEIRSSADEEAYAAAFSACFG